jgi:transcriptional regulator with XRE-family HTH domain
MNNIQQLHDYIRKTYPAAKTELSPPLHEGGIWSLDVDLAEKQLAIQWSPATRFGLSSVNSENFGEGPDEVLDQLELAQRRVDELLTTTERTSPGFAILISRLRERRGITQQELADRLGVRQATISGIEHRDDVQLSTLRRVIEALGGVLEVFGVFPDAHYRLNMPSDQYLSSPVPTISLESIRSAEHGLLQANRFTLLKETGALKGASETAWAIREKHAVIEMP